MTYTRTTHVAFCERITLVIARKSLETNGFSTFTQNIICTTHGRVQRQRISDKSQNIVSYLLRVTRKIQREKHTHGAYSYDRPLIITIKYLSTPVNLHYTSADVDRQAGGRIKKPRDKQTRR